MEQFFMYTKKSTKIIILVIVIAAVALLGYSMYNYGKTQGIETEKNAEKQRIGKELGFDMYGYLYTLTSCIERWNLGEDKSIEKVILETINEIKTIITADPVPKYNNGLDYKFQLVNITSPKYPNEYEVMGSLYVFFNNIQLFFSNEEYKYALWSDENPIISTEKRDYYLADNVLSEEEKQYISKSLELIKMSLESLNKIYDGSDTFNVYDAVKKSLWVEDENKESLIVNFVCKDKLLVN